MGRAGVSFNFSTTRSYPYSVSTIFLIKYFGFVIDIQILRNFDESLPKAGICLTIRLFSAFVLENMKPFQAR